MITYFTSESVCKGHPDKVCDKIADSILDASLSVNPQAHNAVEATIKDTTVFIYGETDTPVDYESIAKKTIREIGYTEDFEVITRVSNQSSEIHNAVESSELGAGDQGIIFGYACNETEELMPLSISFAHALAKELDNMDTEDLLPDGKTQITVAYEDGVVSYIDTILVSKQHRLDALQRVPQYVSRAIKSVAERLGVSRYIDERTEIIVNPSGSFSIGGPAGDSGTTGRKIVVDTYGGHGRVGGGCFSSKDPTKVDRSAAYYARYAAKNIVAAGYADKCEIQVSYGIGIPYPISIHIDCFGTERVAISEIYSYIENNFDFSPANIIEELGLRNPIYKNTACYGHFGNPDYPWEKLKKI